MHSRVSTVVWLGLVCWLSSTASAGVPQFIPGSRSLTGPIDASSAVSVAQRHLASVGTADAFCLGKVHVVRIDPSAEALCYYFELSPAGFLVVSADTALPPVIAYSFTSPPPGELAAGTPLGDLLRWDLGQRLAHADLLSSEVVSKTRSAWAVALGSAPAVPKRGFQQWPKAGTTPTGGWLEANWSQYAPYNSLCPMDLNAGARSVAGCPSLAMAQILDYHRRLNATRFDDGDDYYHSYGSGNRYWIDDDYLSRGFPSFPQLNAHLDGLFEHYFYGTPPTDTRIAALVFGCGVAATQVYSASGSGTFGVNQALDAYQRFGCDSAVLLDSSDPDVYTRLAQNMMDAYPAHLAVVDPAWSYGHNLVVDGYNTDGYYHLNFGWSGSYNGWYLIPSGLPMDLTVLEGVIVDIMTTPCTPLDCTGDGQVDGLDFAYYDDCLTGPGRTFTPPGCTAFDADDDEDVDLRDFGAFQVGFGG